MNGSFYFSYAVRSLYRSGQRSVLAIVCIAFGVLSLVALQLLSAMVTDAFLIDPRADLGGDLRLSRGEAPLTFEQADAVEALRAEGLIGAYTFTAFNRATLLRTEETGRVYFLSQAFGVDPASYPLAGEVRLRENIPFAEAIAEPGHAVITRDIADQLGLYVGAAFTLTGSPGSAPTRLQVAGIAEATPTRLGRVVMYSLETARMVAGRDDLPVRVAALWGSEGDTSPRLEQAGWTVEVPGALPNRQAADLFAFMLGGAGILGLLIGGIGVANTMQVVLARRTLEIATLKALGYEQRHLLLLFGIETMLLGLVGSVLGIAGALWLSQQFMMLLQQSLALLMEYTVDPGIVAGGVLTGVLTAVIFGSAAMVRASAVRPAVLLRQVRVRRTMKTRIVTAGLYSLLALLFGVLSSVLLGSLLKGFGVVAFGIVGLLVLGLVLGGLLVATTRIPLPGFPLVGMARRNLRHRPVRSISALVALFVGVFAIGFATASLFNAQGRAAARAGTLEGVNLLLHAGLGDEAAIRAALAQQNPQAIHIDYGVAVRVRTPDGEPLPALSALTGRTSEEATWDVDIAEGAWSDAPRAAMVPSYLRTASLNLALGDTLRVAGPNGEAMLQITAFYTPNRQFSLANMQGGLLVDQATALQLGGESVSVAYMVEVEPERLEATAGALGAALPQALVVTKADMQEMMNRTFRALFGFVIAVASLAFVAGAVLIANAVGLAMLERRRELGVLKAIGYTSARVLRTVLLENTILGLLSGVTGIIAVFIVMAVVNLRFPDAQMNMNAPQVLGVLAVAVILAAGSAALVAWRPTHLRPLAVLRDE